MRMIKNGLLAAALLSAPALADDFKKHSTDSAMDFGNLTSVKQAQDNQFDVNAVNAISQQLGNAINNDGVKGKWGNFYLSELLKPLASNSSTMNLIANNKARFMKDIIEGDINYDNISNEGLLALLKLNVNEFNERTGGPDKWDASLIEDLSSTMFKFTVPKVLGELQRRDIDIANFMKEHATKEQFDALTFIQLGVHDSEYMSVDVDYKDAITGEDKTLGQVLLNGCLCKSDLFPKNEFPDLEQPKELVVIDVYGYEYLPREAHLLNVLKESKGFFKNNAQGQGDLDVYESLQEDYRIKSISLHHDSVNQVEHNFWAEGRSLDLQSFTESVTEMFLEKISAGHNLPSSHSTNYAQLRMHEKSLLSGDLKVENSKQSMNVSSEEMDEINSLRM